MEGVECGLLFGGFFRLAPARFVADAVEFDGDKECFGVVGAFLVEDAVVGRCAQGALCVLLEHAFEVVLVSGADRVVEQWVEEWFEEVADGLHAAVDVECGDDGLEDCGCKRLGELGLGLHSFADDDEFIESEFDGDFGTDIARYGEGFDLGHLAFEIGRESIEDSFADDHAEYGVAEELEALI